MPRSARLDAPGTLHHVMVRGIEKRSIFEDAIDQRKFLERLGTLSEKTYTAIYAWVLIPNHIHMLLKSGAEGLPHFMRRLLTGYAIYFNKRHKRSGHLFQNRYKSIVCEEDPYFLELVRYIHVNPARAHLVSTIRELDRYPWSGHQALIGKPSSPWQDTAYVLSWFGNSEDKARKAYKKFIGQGFNRGHRDDLAGGGLFRSLGSEHGVIQKKAYHERVLTDQRVLGTGEFVKNLLNEKEKQKHTYLSPDEREEKIGYMISSICEKEGITINELTGGCRAGKLPRIRAELTWAIAKNLGVPYADIARILGVTTSAISKMIGRERS
jgi:putative transposase